MVVVPQWVIDLLNQEDAEAKANPSSDGRKYRLSREDWGNVKRVATKATKQHRHQGIAYIYSNIYAVLNDGTRLELREVGPYKYNDRKWERDEEEKRKAHAACNDEAKIYAGYFRAFFEQQRQLTPA